MTIAQSEDTCVVSGMPRAAILKGYANKIIPLDGLATFLVNQYGADRVAERHAAVQSAAAQGNAEKVEKNDKHDKHEKIEKIPVSSQRS
jgi:hypothetical protein